MQRKFVNYNSTKNGATNDDFKKSLDTGNLENH
jgi:hypothetical protein